MFDSLFSYLASSPSHILIDGILIAFVLYLLLQKRYTPKNESRLSESVKKELIEEWKPEPLCPKVYKKWNHEPVTIESGDSVTCVVSGKEKINMVSTSFYALNSNKDIVENAKEAVRKYGVGSCGPRGFYGTFDVHINLETALTKFLGTDGVLVYSSGYATNCSVIPAFSKRSDLIIYDESCCQSLQVGINLSRSRAMSFKHNDIKDLEAKLKKVELEDKAQNKKLYKKFVVVEGVYFNTGNICNLKEIFDLKERYKFRIIMDDSFGFGVLGKTGRGTPEHFGYKNTDVEIYMGNLGTVLGGVGGFCAGDTIVIHHQKLNAAGFVFSASSPPYLMSIANKSLDLISNNGKQYFDKFRDNLNLLRTQVTKQLGDHYNVHGNVSAPIIHLRLKNNLSNDENIALLEKIVSVSLEQGVLLANTKYVPMDFNPPAPSIRLTVTSEHSAVQIETAVSTLLSATKQVLGN